jgi:CRP-like cAMP-binding protein
MIATPPVVQDPASVPPDGGPSRARGGVDRQRCLPLLECDRELACAVPPEDTELARAYVRTPVYALERGPWEPPEALSRLDLLGLVVTEGVLICDVTVGTTGVSELLGPGDVLRPWQGQGGESSVSPECAWQVLAATRLAVLDGRFARVAARWPGLLNVLLERSVNRSRSLAVQVAIGRVAGIDLRLQLVLWHLADRWGRVTPDGVFVPLVLTHEVLGRLVGARRPSVTTALSRLQGDGEVSRRPDGWLLHGAQPPTRCEGAAEPPC